jgi:hypothetical protein
VAVMGVSSLSFAWPSWTETLPDWTDSHVRAFGFFGGAARLLIPDNAKVAVVKACLYDPQVNRTYTELAVHCITARRCSRRDRIGYETKPRSRHVSASSSAGCLGGFATGSGTAWTSCAPLSPR